jgi:hypothetical protein
MEDPSSVSTTTLQQHHSHQSKISRRARCPPLRLSRQPPKATAQEAKFAVLGFGKLIVIATLQNPEIDR